MDRPSTHRRHCRTRTQKYYQENYRQEFDFRRRMHLYIYLCLAFAYATAQAPAGSTPFPIDSETFTKNVFTLMAEEVNDLKTEAGELTPLIEACKVTINATIDSCSTCVSQNCQASGAASGNVMDVALAGITFYGNPGNYLKEPFENAANSIANFAIKYGAGPAQAIVGGFESAGQSIANFFEGDVLNSLQTALAGIKNMGEQIGKFTLNAGKSIGGGFKDLGSWLGGLGKRRRRSASALVSAHEISREKRSRVNSRTRRSTAPTQDVIDCYNNNCHVCKPFLLEIDGVVSELCPAAAAKNASYVTNANKFQNIFAFFDETNAPNNELIKDVYINPATYTVVQATGWVPPGVYQTYVPLNVALQGFDFVALIVSLAADYHGRVHDLV